MTRTIALVLAALAIAPQAMAHAFLEKARPAVGGNVEAAPQAVSITFTEGVEAHFCHIEVIDSSGARVDTGDVHTERDGKTLVVGVKQLPPGRYAVIWHVVSVDTHKAQGRYDFAILGN
jgi:hypothetical protein